MQPRTIDHFLYRLLFCTAKAFVSTNQSIEIKSMHGHASKLLFKWYQCQYLENISFLFISWKSIFPRGKAPKLSGHDRRNYTYFFVYAAVFAGSQTNSLRNNELIKVHRRNFCINSIYLLLNIIVDISVNRIHDPHA